MTVSVERVGAVDVGDRGVGRVRDEPRRIAVGERELVVRARGGAAVVGVEVDRRPVADAGDRDRHGRRGRHRRPRPAWCR